jgi:phosphoribosyl 1,2-cyclic phosphodiesterase
VTHYHWDHIQGIPFFSPLYAENNEFHFYSFRSKFLGRDSLKQVFETQMALPYFPVDISAMSAKRKFKEVDGGESFTIGQNRITARWLNHPQGCLGFRIETPAGIVVYATDNEPGEAKLDESLRELASGADIFINDAQFTPEQLATARKGWGHSSWLEGVKVSRHAGAKTLVLFHHDPDSTDRMVDSILRQAREEFDSVFAASEGMVIPREGQRRNRRRQRIRGRDHRPRSFPAGRADFVEAPAPAAIRAAGHHGGARSGWYAIDEAARIRRAD